MKSKLTSLFLLLAAPLLHAQATPSLMSYQGRVTDAAGVLIGNTSPVNRSVIFRLYAASSGGTALYAETQTVTISGGEFGVLIGNGAGITGSPGPGSPANTPYKTLSDIINSSTYGSLYLGVTVDDGTAAADPEIAPRQQMVSGAFALRAKVAESVAGGAVTTAMMGDGQVSTGKIASGAVDSSRIADSSIVGADIAGNTITAGKLDTGSIGLWDPVGSSVYRSSGNVGIGNTSPNAKLTVGNAMTGAVSGTFTANSGALGTSAGSEMHLASFGLTTANTTSLGVSAYRNSTGSFWDTTSMILGMNVDTTLRAGAWMALGANGNVGIGTASPGQKLDISGSLNASSNVIASNFTFNGSGDTDGGMYSTADGLIQFRTNGAEKMRINASGYVGIGTSNPTEKLSVQDGKLWFTTASGNGDDGGVGGVMASSDSWRIFGYGDNNNGALYIDTYDDANEPIIFRQSNNERMRIASNGYLGIGTNSPRVPLEVSGSNGLYYARQAYLDDNGAGGSDWSNTWNVSIIASNVVVADEFGNSSDERIKKDLKVTNSALDLDTLLGLEVTNYHFRDSISKGTQPQKKLIAQQVESVYPQAVNQTVGVVPDIYKKATVKDGWIELATDLKVGDRVKLISRKEEAVHEVLEVSEGAFRTDGNVDADSVFVYGREVNDFRTVDYDAISMLNVSATQELSKKLEEKDAVIAALEARLSALEKRVSAAK